jgi:hypothetical protein
MSINESKHMHLTKPGLMPFPTVKDTRPFSWITCNFVTDLPESDRFNSLMVMVDHGLTKRVIAIPCTKKNDTLGTANFILEHVYKRFGLPDNMLSDRGPQFSAKVFRKLGPLLRIKLVMSTAYHPQTDGETE